MSLNIDPFDLVLFCGDSFMSRAIIRAEGLGYTGPGPIPNYSHVGILVNGECINCPNLRKDQWAVYETTITGRIASDLTPDLETGSYKFGTHIRDLKDVVRTYQGTVSILKLIDNPWLKKDDETEEECEKRRFYLKKRATMFKIDNEQTTYQLNIIRLLSTSVMFFRALRFLFPWSANWKMCSQITAGLYKAIGVFPESLETEDVLPIDFFYDSDKEVPCEKFSKIPVLICK